MYDSNSDLPIVCQLNLPEAALQVYREAFNRAWKQGSEDATRFRSAQEHAWTAVRSKFEREKATGRWVPKAAPLEVRELPATASANKKRAAR